MYMFIVLMFGNEQKFIFTFTDNIFSIKAWIKNKFCFEDSLIDKQFEIPTDFDYVE